MKKMLFNFYIGLVGLVIFTLTILIAILNPWVVDSNSGILVSLVQNRLILFTLLGLLMIMLGGWFMYKEIKVAG